MIASESSSFKSHHSKWVNSGLSVTHFKPFELMITLYRDRSINIKYTGSASRLPTPTAATWSPNTLNWNWLRFHNCVWWQKHLLQFQSPQTQTDFHQSWPSYLHMVSSQNSPSLIHNAEKSMFSDELPITGVIHLTTADSLWEAAGAAPICAQYSTWRGSCCLVPLSCPGSTSSISLLISTNNFPGRLWNVPSPVPVTITLALYFPRFS